MAVDLHIHSTASDGTQTPEEIVAEAAERGLTAIAIADHDTVSGIDAALRAAEGLNIEVIPAVEINTDVGVTEAHITGYYIDHHNAALLRLLQSIKDKREQRAAEMVRRLRELGIPIQMDAVLDVAAGGSIGRPHVARALTRMGICDVPQEAFERFLKRGRPAYVRRYKLTPKQAIDAIGDAGGIPTLSHPGLMHADHLIPGLVRDGIQAIEAYHTDHSRADTQRYLRIADEFGLVVVGGSDSHGPRGTRPIPMACVEVPDDVLEALRARSRRLRSERASCQGG
ncbi:MAG: PHP domain-containing protein [Armatimonadota bacterium]